MKRSDDQRLAERLGIKLKRRTGPNPTEGTAWNEPWFGYEFLFTPLLLKTKHTTRCRPGAAFYGSSFGALSDVEAWAKALEQFSEAICPNKRPNIGRPING